MHPTKRTILIGLLGAGTVLGYGGGAFSMACHGKHRRAALERHVAEVCVDAAARARPATVPGPRAAGDGTVAPR